MLEEERAAKVAARLEELRREADEYQKREQEEGIISLEPPSFTQQQLEDMERARIKTGQFTLRHALDAARILGAGDSYSTGFGHTWRYVNNELWCFPTVENGLRRVAKHRVAQHFPEITRPPDFRLGQPADIRPGNR